MQINFRFNRSVAISFFSAVFVFVLLLNSCKKNDALFTETEKSKAVATNRFFNVPANVNSAVARVAAALKIQNEKTGFITELANTAGYPVWGKSTIKLIKENTT